jgi:hypothetical protein
MDNYNHDNEQQKNDLTPSSIIANAARFNKQFINKQIGGNPITVSIGKLLTVMGEQDNTIRILSHILGESHNDKQMHDMHNSIFGGIIESSGIGKEGMNLGDILNQLTTFINQQNQQIRELITKIDQNFQQINNQTKSSLTQ